MRPGRIVDRPTRLEKRRFAAGVSHLSLICRTKASQSSTHGPLPVPADTALRPNTTPCPLPRHLIREAGPRFIERGFHQEARCRSPCCRLIQAPCRLLPKASTAATMMSREPGPWRAEQGVDRAGPSQAGDVRAPISDKDEIGEGPWEGVNRGKGRKERGPLRRENR